MATRTSGKYFRELRITAPGIGSPPMTTTLLTLAVLAFACFTTFAKADLASYVQKPEPDYKWDIVEKSNVAGCDVWQLLLTSQKWQGIIWQHDLVIFKPTDVTAGDTIFLMNNGGKASPKNAAMAAMLATRMKAPVAFLLGVPNQPLFEGKTEDNLIAETFVRFLETKDANWPLLFPMAKSVVKSMDALQEFTAKEWNIKTAKFIVSGASKRGWTTWLTAAVDLRVSAIAPMVIDTLNMSAQLPHQFECFGGYSDEIKPYTERGLVPMPDKDEARLLWSWVDPWMYRARFTMPKLVVSGNNDPYWSTDAVNLYWDGLPGDNKYLSYSPNAGHNLTEKHADGSKGDPFRAVNNVCAFVRCQLTGQAMPQITWKHHDGADGHLHLGITMNSKPSQARLWLATADNKDFRRSRWNSSPLEIKEGKIDAVVPRPTAGYVAYYADLGYKVDDIPQWLCTQLRMAGPAEIKSKE